MKDCAVLISGSVSQRLDMHYCCECICISINASDFDGVVK